MGEKRYNNSENASLWYRFKRSIVRQRWLFRLVHPLHKAWRVSVMWTAQKLCGINPKKAVFTCFEGRRYGDNPRYISERLHELCPECEIVYLFRKEALNSVKAPPYVKKLYMIGVRGLIAQATARFWVDNARHTEALYFNEKKQYYIQTWHGDRGFKRVGDDNEKLPWHVLRMEDRASLMVAGSEFGRGTYRTAFHYQGEVMMDGCPRNDPLLKNDPDEAARIRRELGIPPEVGVLLYAPTYRDTHQFKTQEAVLDVSRTLDHLESSTGRRWRCLYRAHYLNKGLIVKEDPRVMDATAWPEMTDLLLVSDMLITDYSSVGGDFALLRRPLFLYHADAEEYLRESRSFYIDVEKSPFLVARNQEELEKLMDETDAEAARANCEALDRFFGTTETGHATDSVCRYILDRMN